MEELRIFGLLLTADEARITLAGVPNTPRSVGRVVGALAADDIAAHGIEQHLPHRCAATFDLAFTVDRSESHRAVQALQRAQGSVGFEMIRCDDNIGRLSLLGVDMRSHAVVAARLLAALAAAGIRCEFVATSANDVTLIVRAGDTAAALAAARTTFGLAAEQVYVANATTLDGAAGRWPSAAPAQVADLGRDDQGRVMISAGEAGGAGVRRTGSPPCRRPLPWPPPA